MNCCSFVNKSVSLFITAQLKSFKILKDIDFCINNLNDVKIEDFNEAKVLELLIEDGHIN